MKLALPGCVYDNMGFGHKQRRRLPLVTVGCPPAAVTNGSSKSSALVLSRIDACTKPRSRLRRGRGSSWLASLLATWPESRRLRWRPTRHSGPLPVRPRVTSSLRARSRTVPWLLLFVRFCFFAPKEGSLVPRSDYVRHRIHADRRNVTGFAAQVIPSKCTRNWASVSNIGYHGSTH